MFEKKHQNSGTLYKDTINNWIILFLRVRKKGFKSNFDLASIMEHNQIFILMKNCTKVGLRLNKQMVGLTDITV